MISDQPRTSSDHGSTLRRIEVERRAVSATRFCSIARAAAFDTTTVSVAQAYSAVNMSSTSDELAGVDKAPSDNLEIDVQIGLEMMGGASRLSIGDQC